MKTLAFLFSIVFIVPAIALSDENSAIEILSKSEAEAIFGMSLEEWKVHVVDASQSGTATYSTDGELEYTKNYPTPNGFVTVTPSYTKNNQQRPWKLSASLLFLTGTRVDYFSVNDQQLKSFFEQIYRDMLPEYVLFSSLMFSNNQVIQTAEMFEVGYDETVDEAGKKYLGCFKDCILRLSSSN